MARDANGNYTLPAGNPVQPQTIIEVDWANPTMNDIAVALSDSLSRSGAGGMLVPFKFTDGSMGTPGISWNNEPSSGWYRSGLNSFWYSVGNENIFRITKNGVELAPGKTSTGFDAPMRMQDADPAPVPGGVQWFESDTGALYVRYQNPDASYVWVQTNPTIGGNYMPGVQLNTFLGNFADDAAAAAGGVALGAPYRTGSAMKVRVA